MLTKGLLNNIFQDSFNKPLSQQLTHDRSYIYISDEIKVGFSATQGFQDG